jgi:hypothetical protein
MLLPRSTLKSDLNERAQSKWLFLFRIKKTTKSDLNKRAQSKWPPKITPDAPEMPPRRLKETLKSDLNERAQSKWLFFN